ncbi:MAG: type II toxin-antitoxin system VapC family toxin [Legionellaceae bacterium]|nr:type II toxin-antitoxin system VapC family toxin [Legionellaceae bacterium]
MKYMLDTNMCIYIIKQHPERVLKKFITLPIGDVCISSITLAELTYGVYKSQHQKKNKMALSQFLSPLDIMPFEEGTSEYYGKLQSYLEKQGTPIGSLDTMIAAHAQCLDSILVTNNKKEFTRVPDLNIEDWS